MTTTATSEKPIIFTADSVRAILKGWKTESRRVLKRQPPRGFEQPECSESGLWAFVRERAKREWFDIKCPYGVPGDRLWVKEAYYDRADYALIGKLHRQRFVYVADGIKAGWNKHTPLFMPRAASRLTLEIVGVRIERLQDIDELGAVAEGIEGERVIHGTMHTSDGKARTGEWIDGPSRNGFRNTWDVINGRRKGCDWASDPWVWVVEFRKLEAA